MSFELDEEINGLEPIYLEHMSGFDFEDFVATLLESQGYTVLVDKRTDDKGRDIIARNESEDLFVIECKHWFNKSVGRPVVQKVHSAAITFENTARGAIITSGKFSNQAQEYARQTDIWLVDYYDLTQLAAKSGYQIISSKSDDEVLPYILPIPSFKEISTLLYNKELNKIISYPDTVAEYSENVESSVNMIPIFFVKFNVEAQWYTTTKSKLIRNLQIRDKQVLVDGSVGKAIEENSALSITSNINILDIVQAPIPESDILTVSELKFGLNTSVVKSIAIQEIIQRHSERVSYLGGNNVRYSKLCTPKPRQIQITDIKQIYIASHNITIEIGNELWSFIITGEKNKLTRINEISQPIEKGTYICNKCGSTCVRWKHAICAKCLIVLCPHCVKTKKFLSFKILSYCNQHYH